MYGVYDGTAPKRGRLEWRMIGTVGAQANPTALAPGAGSRVRIIVAITSGVVITTRDVASVGIMQGATFVPLGSVSGDHPYLVIEREMVGDIITQSLFSRNTSAEFTLTVSEVWWHPENV